jgi:diphosphomevalonate decarboxylase
MLKKKDVVNMLLKDRAVRPCKPEGSGRAWANIAVCKYWGKRNEELNLPVTSSLSVSLNGHGTETSISLNEGCDEVFLSGRPVAPTSQFSRGVTGFLSMFRPDAKTFYRVETTNTVATASGLASSASGFAALALAANDLHGWQLSPRDLSILARLGSGSASRSIFDGFVEWHAGASADGMDSFAEPVDMKWPDLRLGLIKVSTVPKAVSSRTAMKRTRRTSTLYEAWPVKVAHDMILLMEAIRMSDFETFGQVSESNALAMHATMIGAWPPVLYWLPESVAVMRDIWDARADGLLVYFTMDAGPNVKLLFLARDEAAVKQHFPGVEVVTPFASGAEAWENKAPPRGGALSG